MKPIVCGTDFSENATHAAQVATALATRLGAKLLLVHSVDERGEIPDTVRPALIEEVTPRLRAEAARWRDTGAALEEMVLAGVPDDGVAEFAARSDAQMIVLGASGSGALGRWVLGSVAEDTAESATVATLVVRAVAPLEAWLRERRALKVLVGADFTANSDAALRWVGELCAIGPCEITLAYIRHAPAHATEHVPEDEEILEEERTRALNVLGSEPAAIRIGAGEGRVDSQLLHLAAETGAELIVVGTHQWHGLDRLRHRSVSRHILRDAAINVACVPPPQA